MGKHRQGRESNNEGVNNFKWGRMFNVLDYHRWHYVNKVIPHKKHHVHHVTFSSEDDSNLLVCEKDKCIKNEVTNSQFEAKKLEVKNAQNHLGQPWSPKSKGFWSVPISPKSSRIARIKKSIVKEVTKRKGRHRRSSTCPNNSILENNEISMQEIKNSNLEQFDDTKLVLQDHANLAINHFLYNNKVRRRKSWSFHHSKEFINVVSTSLDDTSLSSRDNLLTKLATSCYNTKSLTKSSSFPPQEVINVNQSSSVSLFKPMIPEESIDSRHAGQFIGRRFKDLRHKIKNLIKENKKERQRIAMDAVLHKVPYGRKVKISDEGGDKESLCVDISEVDPLIYQKNKKSCKRRSPSLDGSIEKYCQLFHTTGLSSEQMDTLEKSNSNVTDDPMTNKKRFERMFSSPDLRVFLNHPIDDNVFSRTPNRRLLTSLSSKKVGNEENIYIDTAKECNTTQEFECTNLEDCESYTSEETLSSSLDKDEENKMIQQNDNMIVDVVLPTLTTLGSFSEKNLDEFGGSSLEADQESTQLLQELSTDEGVIKIPTPVHDHNKPITSYETEEFKYVKDILTLSGYLGQSKLIGTSYSLEHPLLDPSIFIHLESETSSNHTNNNHLLLFDMINEALLSIYERCVSYWCTPLCSCSTRIQLMPKGYHILEEVWNYIYWYICCSIPHLDSSLNFITIRDFDKNDGWMNLQLDAECVGLHLADLIFDDLLIEFLS